MSTFTITFTIKSSELAHVSDQQLAALWHIAQANPAPMDDHAAADLAEKIGREIIRRFVSATPPELYQHQGQHPWWTRWCRMTGSLPCEACKGARVVDGQPCALCISARGVATA